MIPMQPDRSYFVRGEDGEEYGPVDRAELAEWVRENRAVWQPWQAFPELVALLAQQLSAVGELVAPAWKRLAAWFVDMLLALVPTNFALAFFLPVDQIGQQTLNALAQGTPMPMSRESLIYSLTLDAALVLYLALFHAFLGYTPGKALVGIRVADARGNKPFLLAAVARAMALLLSMNLLFLPVLCAFFNPRRRTFHDIIAGTWVIRK
jgi:uncharacterized RDD family membrane protein YckC